MPHNRLPLLLTKLIAKFSQGGPGAHNLDRCSKAFLVSSTSPSPLHGAGEGAPSREDFLQYGVDHGGDRTLLAQGLSSCRDTSVKSNAYKVCACSYLGTNSKLTF